LCTENIRFGPRLQGWQYPESIGKTLDLEIPNWCAADRIGTTILLLFSLNCSHSTLFLLLGDDLRASEGVPIFFIVARNSATTFVFVLKHTSATVL